MGGNSLTNYNHHNVKNSEIEKIIYKFHPFFRFF